MGVGVSEGVGGTGDSEGVKVKVGSGVRLATGVAVNRGVMVTIGASVAVAGTELISVALPEHAASRAMRINTLYLGILNVYLPTIFPEYL